MFHIFRIEEIPPHAPCFYKIASLFFSNIKTVQNIIHSLSLYVKDLPTTTTTITSSINAFKRPFAPKLGEGGGGTSISLLSVCPPVNHFNSFCCDVTSHFYKITKTLSIVLNIKMMLSIDIL